MAALVLGQRTALVAQRTALLKERTALLAQRTALLVQRTALLAQRTARMGQRTERLGQMFQLEQELEEISGRLIVQGRKLGPELVEWQEKLQEDRQTQGCGLLTGLVQQLVQQRQQELCPQV